MLTVTLFRIPFSVIGRCSLAQTSHWLQGKCARSNLSQAASDIILTGSQAASCRHAQCQNRHLRILEASYWQDFQI
jgi:hypothetical protein